MSKMRSLFTYFFVLMAIIWGLYYILLFYGYEQGLIFIKVYAVYYIFLFVTVFFAIIFNSYTGSDDDEGSICYKYNQQASLNAITGEPPISVTPPPLPSTISLQPEIETVQLNPNSNPTI